MDRPGERRPRSSNPDINILSHVTIRNREKVKFARGSRPQQTELQPDYRRPPTCRLHWRPPIRAEPSVAPGQSAADDPRNHRTAPGNGC